MLFINSKYMQRLVLLFYSLILILDLSAQTLLIRTDQKGRCGYVDRQGNIVVPCKYEIAFPFSNGIGKVGKGDKYGLVDSTGKEIVPVKYDEITLWTGDIYRLRNGDKYGLVSNTGAVLADAKHSLIGRLNCYGKALIAIGGKEKNGILNGTKFGLIDNNGKMIVVPKEYTRLCEFSPANGRPEREGGNGVSITDTLKTDCRFISCFNGSKNIVIDVNGNAVTPLTDNATYLMPSSGMCGFSIREGSKVTSGYLDISTKKTILISNKEKKLQALTCTPFTGNIARIDNPATRTSYFIDKLGKRISDDFSKTKHKGNYWIVYGKDKSCNVLSEDGKLVFDKEAYQDIKFPYITDSKATVFPVKQNGKWGLTDNAGNNIVGFEYDDIETPVCGWVWAVRNGRHGIIDVKGNGIVPFEYDDIVKTESEISDNVWVRKPENKAYYNFNVKSQSIIGEGMKLATNFNDGLAWVVPQNQKIVENSIYSGLKDLYNIKAISKIPTSFGVLVDTNGNKKSHIPVPQAMFPIISEEVKRNKGNMTINQEKRLLLSHTRAVRVYALSSKIDNEEWDY